MPVAYGCQTTRHKLTAR